MAVAHEAYARSHAGVGASTSEDSFAFDLAATNAAGVLVFIHTNGNTADLVSAVDVEGVAASAVSGGRAVDTGGETGDTQAWFVGSGLPTGTLTITVTRTNNSVPMWAYAVSQTATTDTAVYAAGLVLDEEDGTLDERSVDDGSPGTDSLRYAALNTGLSSPPSVGANTTSLAADDYGSRCSVCARETTAGQGSRSIGWSSVPSDDRAGVYIAVYESGGGGGPTIIELISASFGFTSNGIQPSLLIILTKPAFNFTANPISISSLITLSKASFNFVANQISVSGQNAIDLTKAAFNFTANSLQTAVAVVLSKASFNFTANPINIGSITLIELTKAVFNFTANALNVVRDTVIQLTKAAFNFTTNMLTITGITSGGNKGRGGGMFMMLARKLTRRYQNKIGKHE